MRHIEAAIRRSLFEHGVRRPAQCHFFVGAIAVSVRGMAPVDDLTESDCIPAEGTTLLQSDLWRTPPAPSSFFGRWHGRRAEHRPAPSHDFRRSMKGEQSDNRCVLDTPIAYEKGGPASSFPRESRSTPLLHGHGSYSRRR